MIEAETSPQESAPQGWRWRRRCCSPVAPGTARSNQPAAALGSAQRALDRLGHGPRRSPGSLRVSALHRAVPHAVVEAGARVRGRALARRLYASRPRLDVHRALPERALHQQRERAPRRFLHHDRRAAEGRRLPDLPVLGQSPHRRRPGRKLRAGVRARGAPLEPAVGRAGAAHRAREDPAGRPQQRAAGDARRGARGPRHAWCRRTSRRPARSRRPPRSSGSRRATRASPSSSSSTTWRPTARTSRPGAFASSCSPPADVDRSYRVDRSWTRMWEYTFGLREYSDDEIRLTRATYDATLLELDELLRDLLEALRETGHLDDTVVILTSDHGEQLGEHHMLDHQYSVYQTLLRVPLIVRAPGRLAAGPGAAPGDELRPVPHAARADRDRAAARPALAGGEPARSPAGSRALCRGSLDAADRNRPGLAPSPGLGSESLPAPPAHARGGRPQADLGLGWTPRALRPEGRSAGDARPDPRSAGGRGAAPEPSSTATSTRSRTARCRVSRIPSSS